jgi:hypothetical protein
LSTSPIIWPTLNGGYPLSNAVRSLCADHGKSEPTMSQPENASPTVDHAANMAAVAATAQDGSVIAMLAAAIASLLPAPKAAEPDKKVSK